MGTIDQAILLGPIHHKGTNQCCDDNCWLHIHIESIEEEDIEEVDITIAKFILLTLEIGVQFALFEYYFIIYVRLLVHGRAFQHFRMILTKCSGSKMRIIGGIIASKRPIQKTY